jgi:hypothetical protein
MVEQKQEETLCDTCKATCAGICGRRISDCLELDKTRSRHEKELKDIQDRFCCSMCVIQRECEMVKINKRCDRFKRVFGEKSQ